MAPRFADPVSAPRRSPVRNGLGRGARHAAVPGARKGLPASPRWRCARGRRADLVALGTDGTIHIIEIKSSIADFRADTKWRDYRQHCDRLYFRDPGAACRPRSCPEDAGLIIADAYGAAMMREGAPSNACHPPRAAMVTLKFAQLAAHRLHGLADSGFRGDHHRIGAASDGVDDASR